VDQAASPGALDRIAALVDADPEFERLAPHVAASVLELVGADGVWVVVRRRDEPDIVLRHWVGVRPRQHAALDLPIAADPLIERAVLASGPLALARYVEDAVRDPFLVEQRVSTVATAALRAGLRDEGCLIAFRRGATATPFDALDADRLAAAARTLALVLTTHAARREHARALARERLVTRAAEATAAAADVAAALARTAEAAAAIADTDLALVLVCAQDGTELVAATPGRPLEVLEAAAFGPLATRTLQPLADVLEPGSLTRRRPILVIDTLAFLTRLGVTPDARRLRPLRGRAAAILPLVDGDDAAGALFVLLERRPPDPVIFAPLEAVAAQAAGMLRRDQLSREIEHAYLATVTALANALEAKDLSTHEHATETSRLAVQVGRRLGLRPAELRDLEFAAVLHDVGKIAIPDEILNRRGPLSDAEWAYVRDHTKIGERILRDIPFLSSAAHAVRSAHERWDGGGYPDGLAGPDIPLLARIVFACDTWDVMTSDRPYRKALPHAEALRRLEAAAGSQLDPEVVAAVLASVGSRSGRTAGHVEAA
jgi:HD-GYP domain-containing protein (c-di-GMP phosphodiesterase class II)